MIFELWLSMNRRDHWNLTLLHESSIEPNPNPISKFLVISNKLCRHNSPLIWGWRAPKLLHVVESEVMPQWGVFLEYFYVF